MARRVRPLRIVLFAILAGGVYAGTNVVTRWAADVAAKRAAHVIKQKTGIDENTTLQDLMGPEKRSLRVNLNTASAKELESLPNVGPARAEIIIAHRPYQSVDQLVGLKSLTAGVVDELRPYVKIEGGTELLPPPIPIPEKRSLRLNINTASLEELQALPGIGPARAEAIIGQRPFETVEQLAKVKGLGQKAIEGLRAFVKTEGATEKLASP